MMHLWHAQVINKMKPCLVQELAELQILGTSLQLTDG